jgi:hypothetical protein
MYTRAMILGGMRIILENILGLQFYSIEKVQQMIGKMIRLLKKPVV